jgi:hypothetical protein
MAGVAEHLGSLFSNARITTLSYSRFSKVLRGSIYIALSGEVRSTRIGFGGAKERIAGLFDELHVLRASRTPQRRYQ